MSGLDTTRLRVTTLAYMGKEEHALKAQDKFLLDEFVGMMADFDSRFVQYPLLCGEFLSTCIKSGKIDTTELLTHLQVLRAVDQLKGR